VHLDLGDQATIDAAAEADEGRLDVLVKEMASEATPKAQASLIIIAGTPLLHGREAAVACRPWANIDPPGKNASRSSPPHPAVTLNKAS
jgi:hypothetical protein